MLGEDDFWRGGGLDPWRGRKIEVSIDFVDYKTDKSLNTILSTYCLVGKPETARLTYVYGPKDNIPPETALEDSDEYGIYGGGDIVKYPIYIPMRSRRTQAF
jgi:hypothetical protein